MSGTHLHCGTSLRRQRVAETHTDTGGGLELNGIDYIEVIDTDAPAGERQKLLDVTFIKTDGVADLNETHFSIAGGSRVLASDIKIQTVRREASTPKTVQLVLNNAGDFSPYELTLHASSRPDTPLVNMDPRLSSITFNFKVECPSNFDCKEMEPPKSARPQGPPTDYMTRDWAGFRQLILDRMSVTLPGWTERNPADLGVTLVELLADGADKVSWFQDAIGTEAFFEKARYRQSLVRHARLLGYHPGQGQNARTAIAVTADQNRDGPTPVIKTGTRFLTTPTIKGPAQPTVLARDPELLESMLARGSLVFEAMEDLASLRVERNYIKIHNWGDEGCCLPAGATHAHLVGDPATLGLSKGDLIIFEERIPFDGGLDDPPDPTHRQLVRLSAAPLPHKDPVFNNLALTEVHWHAEDALRFALPLDDVGTEPSSVVRGNVLLADEGRSVDYGDKKAVPEDAIISGLGDATQTGLLPDDGPGQVERRRLNTYRLVWAAPFDPDQAREQSAHAAIEPRQAPVAAVSLSGDGETWQAKLDLLASDRYAAHIVVESGTEDHASYVRFGDNILGRAPNNPDAFSARIRHGGGLQGNVGATTIHHIVTSDGSGISAIENPLSAVGGQAIESRRAVHIAAPQSFRVPKRAVTVQDYANVAAQHPAVARAYGRRIWTGSWHTITLAIDLVGGGDLDPPLESELREFIESYRLAGHDLQLITPVFVALDIVFFVCVEPDAVAADVRRDLIALFSDLDLADGTQGIFHPDTLDFGEDVALSPLIARAMEIPGLAWIATRDEDGNCVGKFSRLDQPGIDFTDTGAIPIGSGEIPRLDNDRNNPEMGHIHFIMKGGR